MKRRVMRCKRIQGWLPDQYLSNIVGFCDRGRFHITRELRLSCTLLGTDKLYIEGFESMELEPKDWELDKVRCGTCGGAVEIVEVDPDEILNQIRKKEIEMKQGAKRKSMEGPPPAGIG